MPSILLSTGIEKVMKGILSIFLLFAPFLLQGEEYYTAQSTQYLFRFDEEGNTIWKMAWKEYPTGSCGGCDSIACFHCGEIIVGFDIKNGKSIWEKKFPERVIGTFFLCSSPEDTTPPISVLWTEKKRYIFDPRTGEPPEKIEEEIMERIEKAEKRIKKVWKERGKEIIRSPLEREHIEEKVIISWSTKYLFGFYPDGKLKWKISREEYYPYFTGKDKIALHSSNEVRLINKLTGDLIWEHKLPSKIKNWRGCGWSATTTLENGEVYTIDFETKKVKKEEK